MTMRAKYGSYSHPLGQCSVSHTKQKRYNARGRAQTIVHRLNLEGQIIGVGSTAAELQASIRSQIQAMENAYANDGFSGGLLHSDGTLSAHWLSSGDSISGVRVVQPPSFGDSDGGGEYATGRSFTIGLEAEYLISDGDPLVSWEETISIQGNGGPRIVPVETDNSAPRFQVISLATPVIIEQRGSAVGIAGYPSPPATLSGLIMDNPAAFLSRGTPRQSGNAFLDWPISWFGRYFAAGLVNPLPTIR